MLSDFCFGNEQHEIDACQTQPCWSGQSGRLESVVTRNFSAGWGFSPLLHLRLGDDGGRWWSGQFWKHGYIPASLHVFLVSIFTWMVTVLLYLQEPGGRPSPDTWSSSILISDFAAYSAVRSKGLLFQPPVCGSQPKLTMGAKSSPFHSPHKRIPIVVLQCIYINHAI